jgi:hypothetical protein
MADVASTLPNWSTTSTSNGPSNTTTIGSGLDDNLQEIQGVMRRWLANKGANIASASTTDLGAVEGLSHTITGTVTITSFGTVSSGIWKVVQFAGVLTLTHNATSLILPGAASITTAAGDVAILQSEGSGNWRCWTYTKASGFPVISSTVNGPFSDATGITRNSSDATKIHRPRADNITTATTRSTWLVDEDDQSGVDWFPKNLRIAVTTASSKWTINLQDKNAGTLSATNPVYLKFRSATASSGVYDVVNIGAVSGGYQLIIGSGSTIGTVDGMPFRLYVVVMNDGSTPRLAIYNPVELAAASTTLRSLRPRWASLFDDGIYSATSGEDTSTSDSALTLYAGAAVTSKAIRIVGYIEGTQTTAGTWTAAPTKIQMITPSTPRPGSIIGCYTDIQTARTATASTIPFDATIPQISEGGKVMSRTFSAQSAANLLRAEWHGFVDSNNSENICSAFFVGAESDARAVALSRMSGADTAENVYGKAIVLANTTASTEYSIRIGGDTGTTQFLGDHFSGSPAERYGGTSDYVQKGILQIEEIFV